MGDAETVAAVAEEVGERVTLMVPVSIEVMGYDGRAASTSTWRWVADIDGEGPVSRIGAHDGGMGFTFLGGADRVGGLNPAGGEALAEVRVHDALQAILAALPDALAEVALRHAEPGFVVVPLDEADGSGHQFGARLVGTPQVLFTAASRGELVALVEAHRSSGEPLPVVAGWDAPEVIPDDGALTVGPDAQGEPVGEGDDDGR